MSFMIGEIVANVRADSGQFRREIHNVERQGATSSRNVQRSFDGIGRKLTHLTFLAKALFTSGLVLGARNAVREFAYLEGALAKFDVVFAEQAQEMRRWAESFGENVPLARREIVAAAASLQDLLIPMGVARRDATEMTKEWMELAGALAAFNDTNVTEVLEAMQSAIAGQSRPLRRFGIDVRETALQQTALENGLIKTGEAMSNTARQQALLIQAYAQSKDAIDGYEDQLGTTLMLEQRLSAEFKNTQAIIGEGLQPAYNQLLTTLTDLIKSYGEFKLAADGFITVVKVSKEAIDELEKSTGILSLGLGVITKAYNEFNNVLGFNLVKETARDWFEFYQNIGRTRNMLETFTEGVKQYQRALDGGFNPEDLLVSEEQVRSISDILSDMKPKIEAIPPLYDNIFPNERLLTDLEHAEKLLADMMEDFSIETSEFFDFGSIGRMREELTELEEQLIRTTDPEKARRLQAEIDELTNKMQEMRHGVEQTGDSLEQATGAARFFSRTLADGLDQVLFQARSVEDAIKGIIRQLASRALTTGLMGLFGGGFGGSFAGAMFGGFRQSGGGVNAGKGYVVGESGPELFLPNSSGTIVPNGGGASEVRLNINISGGFEDRNNVLKSTIEEQIRQTVRLQ